MVGLAGPESPNHVGIGVGDYGYRGGGLETMLQVWDVSHSSVPAWVDSLPITGGVSDLFVEGDVLYGACTNGGLKAFDISNPAGQPRNVARVDAERVADSPVSPEQALPCLELRA